MDQDKFGAEVVPEVIKIYREQGNAACKAFIQDLIDDVTLALTERQIWRLRSLFWSREKNYQKEIECFDQIIYLEGSQEISSFYLRGHAKFLLKDYDKAINDFTRALSIGRRNQDYSYQDTLYFFLAEIYLRLGRIQESLESLNYVHDDFTYWTDKLQSKKELLNEIRKKDNAYFL